MTLKIETVRGDEGTSIKLIGRLRAESLPDLEAEIKGSGTVLALEMGEVTLVDLDVVRFLNTCESQGIELRGCPLYIREWITQEKEPHANASAAYATETKVGNALFEAMN
jgi:hypothetical protein